MSKDSSAASSPSREVQMDPKIDDEKLELDAQGLNDWINELYGYLISDDKTMIDLYEKHRYKGFDRDEILMELKKFSKSTIREMIIICALNGPVKAEKCKINDQSLLELGVPARRKPGVKGLSCGRINSSTADFAAFFLKKMNFPKRLSSDCPGWLQFPSAGSIRLSPSLRKSHREFTQKFSELIKPKGMEDSNFNEQIYNLMEQNSYLHPSLEEFIND
jgi:uncharacterized protein (UPF0297 family)